MFIGILVAGCAAGESAEGAPGGEDAAFVTIEYRQFSDAPTLGGGDRSTDPRGGNYGALRFFIEKAEAKTAALGPGKAVRFTRVAGPAAVPDVATATSEAAYVAGGSLDPVWGFVFNSVPFGPGFRPMVDFIQAGGGMQLANRILAERQVDVHALPVVGSPAQMSGYFKRPVGVPECTDEGDEGCAADGEGIGMEGLCAEAWTLRYLPPAETIVDLSCDRLGGPRRLEFVQAIPGGSEYLPAIQQGAIDGLEFATPFDDLDAARGGFFLNADSPAGSDGRNAADVGLRFAHYPAWHQPFYLGWMVLNRSEVWDRLDDEQRAALEEAAREAVVESYAASSSVQCEALEQILTLADGDASATAPSSSRVVLTRWRDADLERLKQATIAWLQDGAGSEPGSPPRAEFERVIAALQEHLGFTSIPEMIGAWEEPQLPVEGGCAG